jgi:oxygen-dependent protoporphyrinogen oxidase
MLAGVRRPELLSLDDRALLKLLEEELRLLLGVKEAPTFAAVQRWPAAIPQYEVGHAARVAEVNRRTARFPGLHFTGNYLDGISVAHCVSRAHELAQRSSAWNR